MISENLSLEEFSKHIDVNRFTVGEDKCIPTIPHGSGLPIAGPLGATYPPEIVENPEYTQEIFAPYALAICYKLYQKGKYDFYFKDDAEKVEIKFTIPNDLSQKFNPNAEIELFRIINTKAQTYIENNPIEAIHGCTIESYEHKSHIKITFSVTKNLQSSN
ncbi:MAG: hypothetical protein J6T10_11835 [Methanobrevibacter sp.]|nr:hypothetical protein [Methanobrevibacter sp.]